MSKKYKILLLNSGGADSLASAVLLHKANYDVYSLFIDYGQPNAEAEYKSVRNTMHKVMDDTNENALTDRIFKVMMPLGSKFGDKAYDHTEQEIYLRNFVFMSYACQLAYSLDIQNIAMGYQFFLETVDYIDDNPVFLQKFHGMINSSFGMRLVTPIAGFDKDMVYTTLLDAGIDPVQLPYCNTPKKVPHVLQRDIDVGRPERLEPCGKCHKCLFTKEYLIPLKNERDKNE